MTRTEAEAGARWARTACEPTTSAATRLADPGLGGAVIVGPGPRRLERPVAVVRLTAEEPAPAASRRCAPALVPSRERLS